MFACCRMVDVDEPQMIVVKPQSKNDEVQNEMKKIEDIGNVLVESNLLTKEEADQQVTAIGDLFTGKMSYAEMRAIAG